MDHGSLSESPKSSLTVAIIGNGMGGGWHYGLGGQIIQNAEGHKKLRQRAQNSGKTQDTPEVSSEILLS